MKRDTPDALHAADLDEIRQGLRMSAPRDEQALQAEARMLDDLSTAPWPSRIRGYLRLLGPGYMQSAMTLGAGSAASALFAGAMYGYELLWVAPVGMLVGVMMMAAIAHQTLSTGMRPLPAIARHAGRPIAYGFAVAALLASVIWHFPQYNLAASALSGLLEIGGAGQVPKLGSSFVVLVCAVALALLYGSGARFVRTFERALKWLVWSIVACLLFVVLATDTDWSAVFAGFVPSIPSQQGDNDPIELVASGLAAAIGVNMVFLFPYSLLARGWGRSHRSLARWDLSVGMLLPYALATSLMTIAAANTLHGGDQTIAKSAAIQEAGRVLGDVIGPIAGQLVFQLGMLAMALSTITLHMIVCGFVGMELFGAAFGSRAHRLWTLLPIPGVLAPLYWGKLAVYLAVPTNIVCGVMLPLAYLAFLILQRSDRYLGKDRPRGPLAAAWLLGMSVVTAAMFAFFVWTAIRIVPGYFDSLAGS
jgi:manganese transport protein